MEEKKRKKIQIGLIVGGIVFVLLVVIISIVLMGSRPEEKDSGPGSEIEEFSAVFENRYQLAQLYGDDGSGEILAQMEKVIFDEEEMKSATSENVSPDEFDNHYTVEIMETSVKKYTEFPLVYVFDVKVSDGRNYKVYSRQDTEYNSETEERESCFSTVIVRGEKKILNTDATNEALLDALQGWFEKIRV